MMLTHRATVDASQRNIWFGLKISTLWDICTWQGEKFRSFLLCPVLSRQEHTTMALILLRKLGRQTHTQWHSLTLFIPNTPSHPALVKTRLRSKLCKNSFFIQNYHPLYRRIVAECRWKGRNWLWRPTGLLGKRIMWCARNPIQTPFIFEFCDKLVSNFLDTPFVYFYDMTWTMRAWQQHLESKLSVYLHTLVFSWS